MSDPLQFVSIETSYYFKMAKFDSEKEKLDLLFSHKLKSSAIHMTSDAKEVITVNEGMISVISRRDLDQEHSTAIDYKCD